MKKNYKLYNDHPACKNFEEFIFGCAERFGDKNAITYKKSPRDRKAITVSYKALAQDVRSLACEMEKEGMAGEHCAIVGALSYEWICTYIALQMIGAVAVPLDREWSGEDLASTIAFAECKYLFCDSELSKKTDTILSQNTLKLITLAGEGERCVSQMISDGDAHWRCARELNAREMSVLVFTSGTTGKGKGVMLCQDGILSDIYNGLKLIRAGERSIVSLPPHHTYGANIGIIALLYAGTSIYLSNGLKYIVQEMKDFKPDFMVLVPLYIETFHRRITASIHMSRKEKLVGAMTKLSNALRSVKIDLRRKIFKQIHSSFGGELRFIVCGGAPLRPELVRDFDDLGITLLNGYGITECSPLISVNRNNYNIAGSIGVPIPSMDIRIENPNEEGEGEICVRGSNVMLGYYKEPEATAQVIDSEGYFHTGDIGKTENEVLYITGRIKNLIILSNGKNVYPEEIETDISAIPGVCDVVIYEGISRRGAEHNQVTAEIYPDSEYLREQGIENAHEYFQSCVRDYNRNAVKYKQVGAVKVRNEEFPKNTLRKITRFKLDMSID